MASIKTLIIDIALIQITVICYKSAYLCTENLFYVLIYILKPTFNCSQIVREHSVDTKA